MKNKILYPFALSTLVLALAACGGGGGGESANVIAEPDNEAITNGTCEANSPNCIEWGLEYPLDGLNFNCSGDKENKFITLFDLNNGVATGTCQKTDDIEIYLQSFSSQKINLGRIKMSDLASVSTGSQLPRLSVLDIAKGITGRNANSITQSDATVQVAMKLVKILQALSLEKGNIYNPKDVQPLYITEEMRKKLASIDKDISLTDANFNEAIKPFVDVTKISDADAFAVVKKLTNIANAAVYQPEFSLFSTSGSVGTNLSGSDGLVGCNKVNCSVSDKSVKHLFGHFVLLTDRQGYTFGSGLQWRDSQLKLASSSLTSLAGINAEMIRKIKPEQMTAAAQQSWIQPSSKTISTPYKISLNNQNTDLEIYQGRLLSDYVIAGKEAFYKLVTGKTDLDANDRSSLGLWRLSADSEQYSGTVDLYKIFPISYLDRKVFKTAENVNNGEKYIFPMYGNLEFKFNDKNVAPITVGVVIDSEGDVRTNMQSATDLSTHSSLGCQGDVLTNNLVDSNAVQQYRLGTLGRTFTQDNTVSMRLVLANAAFGKLNGALVGMNSSIQASNNSSDNIVVGGALLNLSNVLSTSVGQMGRVTFANSVGDSVGWANTYASFQQIYNNSNEDETAQDTELAKYSGGQVSFKLADCYTVKAK